TKPFQDSGDPERFRSWDFDSNHSEIFYPPKKRHAQTRANAGLSVFPFLAQFQVLAAQSQVQATSPSIPIAHRASSTWSAPALHSSCAPADHHCGCTHSGDVRVSSSGLKGRRISAQGKRVRERRPGLNLIVLQSASSISYSKKDF